MEKEKDIIFVQGENMGNVQGELNAQKVRAMLSYEK